MISRSQLTRKKPMKAGGGLTSKKFDQACRNALSGLTAKADKPKKIKSKKCSACKEEFIPQRPLQVACSTLCAMKVADTKREKKEREQMRADRVVARAKKEANKGYWQLVKEAQAAFNAYVRFRDVVVLGQGCICCGKPFTPNKPGGSVDAGHYISRGAAPHLRFDERNVFAQRKGCNRPGGTTKAGLRAGVEKRIGFEALEALEAAQYQTRADWTHDDLRTIRRLYQLKLKDLRAKHAEG